MSTPTHMVAVAPCGCISGAALTPHLTAREQAEFLRESVEDGYVVELLTDAQFAARRDSLCNCPHEPRWGGIVSKFRDCPDCHKRVLKKRDGSLRAHAGMWGRYPCPQEDRFANRALAAAGAVRDA